LVSSFPVAIVVIVIVLILVALVIVSYVALLCGPDNLTTGGIDFNFDI
jgi:hypothetical protein